MKKAIKIVGGILLVLVLALIIFLKTMVGSKSIYISTGFDKDVMIKVDQTQTTKAEVMVHITDMAMDYEELFGPSIWNDTIEGKMFPQYVADQIKSKLTRIKCMNQVAHSRGIVLSNLEEQNLGKAATEYFESIDKASLRKYSITKDRIQEMYRSLLLADKLFSDLTYEVDTEISEDEARVITIQYIRTESLDQAVIAKTHLAEGTSFASLVKNYNMYEYTYELRRGEMEEAFEEAAFDLVTGEISDIVETSQGYYIIMCVNEYDKAKTAANKETMINENKLAKFNEIFESYEAELYAEYNTPLWDTISLEERIVTSVRFEDVYNKYFN